MSATRVVRAVDRLIRGASIGTDLGERPRGPSRGPDTLGRYRKERLQTTYLAGVKLKLEI